MMLIFIHYLIHLLIKRVLLSITSIISIGIHSIMRMRSDIFVESTIGTLTTCSDGLDAIHEVLVVYHFWIRARSDTHFISWVNNALSPISIINGTLISLHLTFQFILS